MRHFGVDGSILVALLSVATFLGSVSPALGQEAPRPETGPVIRDFGPVWDIPDPDFSPSLDRPLRVVFDVAQAAPSPEGVNPRLETLARYLNMHARAGVPTGTMHLALVVHGGASWELTEDAAYRERFGVANPNLPLLQALDEQGVEIVLCGQSQSSRGIPRDALAAPVQVALSAMTALVELQGRGYQLIAF